MLNNLLKSKYYKVRLNRKDKVYTVTKQIFKTKAEGLKTIKSTQYEILNVKNLTKMEAEGWISKDSTKNIVKSQRETVNDVVEAVDLTGNPEVEAEIEAYEAKMNEKLRADEERIEKDIAEYEAKMKRMQEFREKAQRMNGFISKVNSRNTQVVPFSYEKQWNKHYKSVERRNKVKDSYVN